MPECGGRSSRQRTIDDRPVGHRYHVPCPERNRFHRGARSCEAGPMGLGFSGEVVDYYERFRRGYPGPVVDALVGALRLRPDDVVLDLGCGTGQLTLPLAGRARSAIGMDVEP